MNVVKKTIQITVSGVFAQQLKPPIIAPIYVGLFNYVIVMRFVN